MDKTLEGITSFLEEALFSEEYAGRDGLLQRIDPRAKLLTTLFLIVALSLSTSLPAIAAAYLLSLLLARASEVELRFYLLRVWFFIPLFAGVIALPSMFTPLASGTPILTLFQVRGVEVSLTGEGVGSAALFVARVAASVSYVLLLVLTTRWSEILRALRVLKVPLIFVMVTEMTYRYIHLLIRVVREMHLGRKSRTIVGEGAWKGQEWVAGRIGHLFRRSYDMSMKVHQAMISRGYTGEARTLGESPLTRLDMAWSFFAMAAGLAILMAG